MINQYNKNSKEKLQEIEILNKKYIEAYNKLGYKSYNDYMSDVINNDEMVKRQKEIDEYNIYEATKIAMKRAINEVNKKISLEHILIDAMPLELDIPTTSIIKGDAKSISIAAASVIAKVTRDRMMIELDKKYPEYGYASHKGYPTKKHVEAIHQYGLIDGYRKSYGPVKEVLEKSV